MESAVRKSMGIAGGGLVELVVSVGLLGVVLSGLFSLSTSVLAANGQGDSISTALRLATGKLEILRSVSFAELASGSDPTTLSATGAPTGIYSRSWTVTSKTIGSIPAKDVVVTVTWPQGRPVSLATTFAGPPSEASPALDFFPGVLPRGWEQVR